MTKVWHVRHLWPSIKNVTVIKQSQPLTLTTQEFKECKDVLKKTTKNNVARKSFKVRLNFYKFDASEQQFNALPESDPKPQLIKPLGIARPNLTS